MEKEYFKIDDIPETECGKGLKRKILANADNMMVVRVHFEKGAIGATHTHVHEQVTYCESGKFVYHVLDKKYILEPHDSVYVASNLEHGLECLEEGYILDIFTPTRKDFK